MLTAQQELKKKIATVENERLLENLKCFVMGMKAQEKINLGSTPGGRKDKRKHREV